MNIRRIINKHLRHDREGVRAAGDVNAVVSANIGEGRGTVSKTSSRQTTRVVQHGGRTVVSETHAEKEDTE
jgi:hypothetical protein